MDIKRDIHRGTSGGGTHLRPTEEEADCRNSLHDNLRPSPPDSSSLTKTSAPHSHRALPAAVPRIGSSTSRQVTFSKRRTGLFKKAYELSALCEADVAVIIFSSTNRMYKYASSSMSDILERYQQCSSFDLRSTDHLLLQQDGETLRREALYLQQHLKYLIDLQSYVMGEDLSSLSLYDLQTFETILGVALKTITARKMELLPQVNSQTSSQKESFSRLQEENELLKRKVAELTAVSSDRGQTSSTIGTACSGTLISDCNATTSWRRAAHTSDDDCHDGLTLKLGL